MPLYDVRCEACGARGECVLDSSVPIERREAVCSCGGRATIEWRAFGGMMGKNKGIYPHHDIQLGMTIESSQHRDAVLKSRGLAALGPQEFQRTLNTQHEPEPEQMADSPGFHDAMEKAYADIQYGNIPIEQPKTLDPAKGQLIMTPSGVNE